MASVVGGRNNCPTSHRDGICVDLAVNTATIAEIESYGGNPFMPTAADIAARDKRDSLFLPDEDVGDLQSELDGIAERIAKLHSKRERKAAQDEQDDVAADIADRLETLSSMAEPTAEELLLVDEPTAEELIAAYNDANGDETAVA